MEIQQNKMEKPIMKDNWNPEDYLKICTLKNKRERNWNLIAKNMNMPGMTVNQIQHKFYRYTRKDKIRQNNE